MNPNEEIVEVIEVWRDENGVMRGTVRLASGVTVVKTVLAASLEGQITRADGTVEPKQLLSATHWNPVTNQRLREEGVGEVRFKP